MTIIIFFQYILFSFHASSEITNDVHTPNQPYCRYAPFRCNPTRSDDNYIVYFDSRCYCDLFCHTDSFDCCPDFEEVCLIQSNIVSRKNQLTNQVGNVHTNIDIDDRQNPHKNSEFNKDAFILGNFTGDGSTVNDLIYAHSTDTTVTKACKQTNALLNNRCDVSLKCKNRRPIINYGIRDNFAINNPRLLLDINSNAKSWSARPYYRWNGSNASKTIDQIFGDGECNPLKGIENIKVYDHDNSFAGFRPRIKWDPRISSRWPIGPIRDQQRNPISWIVSSVDVAADRFARMSYISNIWNRTTQPFSISHMLRCLTVNKRNSKRLCNNLDGAIVKVWNFLSYLGTVTEKCYPATPPGDIPARNEETPKCTMLMRRSVRRALRVGAQFARVSCPGNGIQSPEQHTLFFRVGKPYRLAPGSIRDIQYEIFLRGSVQGTMLVCPDFLLYSTGIYKGWPEYSRDTVNRRRSCRYHSVRIIGWGHAYDREANLRLYWICANSWGQAWGEKGYFRIFSNQSEISDWVVTTFGHGEEYVHRMVR